MMMTVSKARLVSQARQGPLSGAPVGDNTSCLSCPSMYLSGDLLMPDAETGCLSHRLHGGSFPTGCASLGSGFSNPLAHHFSPILAQNHLFVEV